MHPPDSPVPLHATASQPARPKIHALTSARFFAALYVVFFHTKWGIVPGSMLDRVVSLGYISVCFFFLLSGYILATVYLRSGKPITRRSFYVARFARIYPLYFLSVLADVPFAITSRIAALGLTGAITKVALIFAGSTVMLQMWIPSERAINTPSWSLATETVFYLIFPFLGIALWKLRGQNLWIAAIALYIGGVALNGLMGQLIPHHVPGVDLLSYTSSFALGILLARWQVLRAAKASETPVSNRTAWAVLTVASLAFAFTLVEWPRMARFGFHFGILLAPVFAAVIWVLADTQIWPVRLLTAKWLVVLGEASYGLYLIHFPVMHLFERYHLAGSAWNYPLYLGASIGLSILSFYFFETPSRRWILSRFHSRPKETMEAASAAQ